MNEIYQTIQNMDLFNIGNAFSELDKSGHVLTETEIIILAVTAAAVLSVKFAAVLTILSTACCGAVIAGPAVYYLLPDTGMDVLVRILLCTLFGAGGVLVQLLLESKKRKKQSLKKAEEIRNEISTENEVERARAAMNDLEGTTEAESEIDGESSEKIK